MKNIFIILFLILSVQVSAQDTIYSWLPIIYDGKTYQQLKTDSLILDTAPNTYMYSSGILFFSVKIDSGQIEFYKQDDSTFYYREKINGKNVNLGYYLIDKRQPIDTAYFISFDPETFKESFNIRYYYSLIKHGYWREGTDYSKPNATGSYNYGKRNGQWFINENGLSTNARYQNGLLVSYYMPSKKIIEESLSWFIDKPMHWLEDYYTTYQRKWTLSDTIIDKNYPLGVFTFHENKTFDFELSGAKKLEKARYMEALKRGDIVENTAFYEEGKGTWAITNDKFTITFKDGVTRSFKVQYLSQEYLVLNDEK